MDSQRQPAMTTVPRQSRRLGSLPTLTVGVEEEFVLVDRETRIITPDAPVVLAKAAERIPDLQPEITKFQVETCTPVCGTMDEVRQALTTNRGVLSEIAAKHGLGLVSTGVPVLSDRTAPPITDDERYVQMNTEFRTLTHSLTICGCHIHVGLPELADKLTVSNHLRAWLPILLALSANSPFAYAHDTGYASWRYQVWAQWPSAGPPPLFSSPQEYEREVAAQLHAEAALDQNMIYWDIRPSQHHPTIEIRICDALPTVDEAVLIAAVVRAMVATALITQERPPTWSQSALKAASWRAARDGLEGSAVNPGDGRIAPTVLLVKQLIEWIQPALDQAGDRELVTDSIDALLSKGSGARRQREAYARNNSHADVVDLLVAQTAGDISLL